MLETALAQLRLIASITLNKPFALWSLDWFIEAMLDTQREFGMIEPEAVELLTGPALDEEARRELHLHRFRAQAVRAVRETDYYGRLFKHIELNPDRLSYEDISRIPSISPAMLQANPDAFVRRTAKPSFGAVSGMTGRPVRVYFSKYEIRLITALTAIKLLLAGEVEPDDVVHISYPTHALHLALSFGNAYARLGALVYLIGQIEPVDALAQLTAERHLAGRKLRPSILLAYPSYLGELVECGLQLGYHPANFGLKYILTTGEIITAGLKARCRRLFGPVQFKENYVVTAILPLVGTHRLEGGLQFETLPGLVEVLNPETALPALPGEVGTIVVTPFLPYRDTTLLLRYDTQDMVRLLDGPPTYGVTSHILGKLNHSVRHEHGWTFPYDVQQALELVEEVPLPARYGFWATAGGVAVEVLARSNNPSVRRKIELSLAEQGVPVRELHLVEDRSHLRHPVPLHCNLRDNLLRPYPLNDKSTNETSISGSLWVDSLKKGRE